MEKLLLKPMEAAELLGLGRARTYELLARGELPSIRLGRSIRVPVAALREWVEKQQQAGKLMDNLNFKLK